MFHAARPEDPGDVSIGAVMSMRRQPISEDYFLIIVFGMSKASFATTPRGFYSRSALCW